MVMLIQTVDSLILATTKDTSPAGKQVAIAAQGWRQRYGRYLRAISESLILKIFLGEHMPPDPPSFVHTPWPYQSKILGSGPAAANHAGNRIGPPTTHSIPVTLVP